jgi:hypothetical protein
MKYPFKRQQRHFYKNNNAQLSINVICLFHFDKNYTAYFKCAI